MAKKKKKKKFSPGDVRDRHNYFETFFTRYEKIIFSLLVLLGIVLRIVIYHQLNRHRTLFEPSTGTDMGSYWEWANRVAGGEISREAFYMSPLYPYTVGLLIKMFGSSVSNVIVFQSLLGILNAVMIYFIARRLFGVIPAIFVLAGMLFHSMFILYENVILITTLSMFLNIAVLLLLNVYQFSKKNRFLYLSALVFGLNVLARGNILLFLPCVFIWILWKEKKYFRKGLGKITIYILIVLTVISPASLHNYHAEKEFILVTSNLGVNFFIGNHYDAKGWFSYPSEKMDIPHDLSSRQKSDYFVKKTFEDIKRGPGKFIKRLFFKAYLMINSYEIAQNVDLQAVLQNVPLLSLLIKIFSYGLWFSLAGITVLWALINKKRETGIFVLYVISYLFSVVIFFVTARFRMPVVPILILFAGNGIYLLLRYVCTKQIKPSFFYVFVFIFLYSLANIRPADVEAINKGERLRHEFNRAIVYVNNEKYSDALALLKQITRTKPDYFRAQFEYGVVLYELGNYRESVEHLERAVNIRSNNARAYYQLGRGLLQLDNINEAEKNLKKSYDINPDDVNILTRLASVYLNRNKLDAAKKLLDETVKKYPDNGKTHALIAVYYYNKGDKSSAIVHIKIAAALDPDEQNVINIRSLFERKGLFSLDKNTDNR